jgi:PAS domain-containing protein
VTATRDALDPLTAIPVISAGGIWAVDPELTTLFVSPGFARLVGINRLVLAGLPWFTIIPETSLTALEWLVDTEKRRPSSILELRHLEGARLRAVALRVYGGPDRDKVVLRVIPLARPTVVDPSSAAP